MYPCRYSVGTLVYGTCTSKIYIRTSLLQYSYLVYITQFTNGVITLIANCRYTNSNIHIITQLQLPSIEKNVKNKLNKQVILTLDNSRKRQMLI